MRLAQTVQMGAWLVVGLNLLMALGAIGILMRMAPAIAGIMERNERSIHAGAEMLATLALVGDDKADDEARQRAVFKSAFNRAANNVTEKGELDVLQAIAANSDAAFAGEPAARRQTVTAIMQLGNINREAMHSAERRARQFGEAGVWGVVFMAICVFSTGLLFLRNLLRRVINPMLEVHTVVTAYRNGDTMRRCMGEDAPQDIRAVFYGINELLDQGQAQVLSRKDFSKKVHEKQENTVTRQQAKKG